MPVPSSRCHQSGSALEGFEAIHANDLYGILDSLPIPVPEPDPGIWSPPGPPSSQEALTELAAVSEASAQATLLGCAASSEAALADVAQAEAADASLTEEELMDKNVCQSSQANASWADDYHCFAHAQQRLQAGEISGECSCTPSRAECIFGEIWRFGVAGCCLRLGGQSAYSSAEPVP